MEEEKMKADMSQLSADIYVCECGGIIAHVSNAEGKLLKWRCTECQGQIDPTRAERIAFREGALWYINMLESGERTWPPRKAVKRKIK